MHRLTRLTALCLACLLVSRSVGFGAGRINTSMVKKIMQAQSQQSQAQQKALQEAAARQAAIEQHKREVHAKASKDRHEKEDKDRQATLERLKAKQGSASSSAKTDSPKAKSSTTEK